MINTTTQPPNTTTLYPSIPSYLKNIYNQYLKITPNLTTSHSKTTLPIPQNYIQQTTLVLRTIHIAEGTPSLTITLSFFSTAIYQLLYYSPSPSDIPFHYILTPFALPAFAAKFSLDLSSIFSQSTPSQHPYIPNFNPKLIRALQFALTLTCLTLVSPNIAFTSLLNLLYYYTTFSTYLNSIFAFLFIDHHSPFQQILTLSLFLFTNSSLFDYLLPLNIFSFSFTSLSLFFTLFIHLSHSPLLPQ